MFQLSLLGRTFHKASAIFLDNDAFNFGSRLYKSNSPMAYTYSNIFVINISVESNLYISVCEVYLSEVGKDEVHI